MPFNEIECKDVDEFWNYLDPRNPLKKGFTAEESEKLVYRGQSDSNWSLLPTALRKYKNYGGKRISTFNAEKQVEYEFTEIKEFVNHPTFRTSLGQKLSNIDIETLLNEKYLNNKFKTSLSEWPDKDYYPIIALAQHHGINTRLLDWTKYSYIAAYFASQPHLWKDEKNTEFIAIWIYLPHNNSRIIIKDLPLSSDENMNSQLGLFSLVGQNMKFGNCFQIETVDDIVSSDFLWKIKLQKKYVPDVMRLCNLHHINAGSIYASRGFFSTAEACKEKKQWKEMAGNVTPFSIFTDPTQSIGGNP